MITAVVLVCLLDQSECGVITSTSFYQTQEECVGDIGNAVLFAQTQGQFVVDYYCHNWGNPA